MGTLGAILAFLTVIAFSINPIVDWIKGGEVKNPKIKKGGLK